MSKKFKSRIILAEDFNKVYEHFANTKYCISPESFADLTASKNAVTLSAGDPKILQFDLSSLAISYWTSASEQNNLLSRMFGENHTDFDSKAFKRIDYLQNLDACIKLMETTNDPVSTFHVGDIKRANFKGDVYLISVGGGLTSLINITDVSFQRPDFPEFKMSNVFPDYSPSIMQVNGFNNLRFLSEDVFTFYTIDKNDSNWSFHINN
jgi:hypothetical protein